MRKLLLSTCALIPLLCSFPITSYAQRTRIRDTVLHADGTPAQGSYTITLFRKATTYDQRYIASTRITRSIAAGGVLDVELEPNDNMMPAGSYYSVEYSLARSPRRYTETWVVPTSTTTLRISDVLVESPPDWSGYPPLKPLRTVSTLPPACAVGEYVMLTTGQAGRNTYACTSPNTWSLQGDGGEGTGGGGAPADAPYITTDTVAGLTAERILTAGAGISVTDNGPNSTITVAQIADSTNQRVRVSQGGNLVGTRREINFTGSGVNINATDDNTGNRVNVTITGVGGSGTTNRLPVWTTTQTLGNSSLTEDTAKISSTKPIQAAVWDSGGAVINVKAYGAEGNGTTNDTAAIQNALNAAPAGSTVFFPCGSYLITSTLSVTKKISVVGASSHCVEIRAGFSSGSTLYIEASNVTVKGLSFWPQTNKSAGAELHVKNVGINGIIEDVIVRGPNTRPYNGVYLENTNTVFVRNVISYDATGQAAVWLRCSTDSPHTCGAVLDSVFARAHSSGGAGLRIEASSGKAFAGTIISNSQFDGGQYGIWLKPNGGTLNEVFVQNVIIGNYSSRGIYMYDSSGSGAGHKFQQVYVGTGVSGAVAAIEVLRQFGWITFEEVQSAGVGSGIVLRGVQNASVRNSEISCDGSSSSFGIRIVDDGGNPFVNVSVIGNKIGYGTGGGTTGQVCGTGIEINVQYGGSALLVGNRVYGSVTGLSLVGSAGWVRATDNVFENTSRPSCSGSLRGSTWFAQAGSGAKDDYSVCEKDASDAYSWVALDSSGGGGGGGGGSLTLTSDMPAAVCQAGAAATAFSYGPSAMPSPVCLTGSNTVQGALEFNDSQDLYVQTRVRLPANWNSTAALTLRWNAAATSGAVVWSVQTACVAPGESVDPSWNTAQTVTTNAPSAANTLAESTISPLTMTGCAPEEYLYLRFGRLGSAAADTMSGNARLLSVALTTGRTL